MANILITEVNSNAEGGDFFELYNYGATTIDMSGWRWTDSAGSGDADDIGVFPSDTLLGAGQRLIVFCGTADEVAEFRAAWGLPDDMPILALGGPGLGKNDGVVVVDADKALVAGFNYRATDFSTHATEMGGHVIAPSSKTGGGTGTGNEHAGTSFGAGADSVSVVWDGVSTANPAYKPAVAGEDGAFAQANPADGIGSPGGAFIAYSATTLAEAPANDGSIVATLTLSLRGDTFASDLSGKYAIANLPAGLAAELTRTSDTTAMLSFSGAATDHADADDLGNLTLAFQDGAFTNNGAANVLNSVKNDLALDFSDPTPDVMLSYSTIALNEARTFDGSLAGGIEITLTGDTFAGSDGDDLLGTAATLDNAPAGLAAVLTRTSATTATLSFTGTAANHADADDVSNLTLTFLDAAFTGGNALAVAGNGRSDLQIDFSEPNAAMADFRPNGQGSDASAALALDANYMIVGDDEANVLRVYDRKGGDALALNNHGGETEWDFESVLGLDGELDLEGGTRIGDTFYFTGSSGNKKDGDDHPSRENLFSVQVSGTGADTTFSGAAKLGSDNLESLLVAWDSGNAHGLGAGHFGFAAAAAEGVIPENAFGFSIEGLTAKASSNTLLLGFRAPQTDATTRENAVIVELNLGAAGALSGASLGAAHELNLGGRGIRSIEQSNEGDYLILAGPAGAASDEVTHDFRLFRWDGASITPTELDVDLDALRADTGGSFETIVDVLSTAAGTWVQLLQDNGDTIWSGKTEVSKDLPGAEQKFVGNWVQIGGDVADTAGPALQGSSPADGATSASVRADLVLRFDEGVKIGSGDILIKKVSDGSIVATIDAGDASQVSVAFNTVTIDPAADLDAATAYYVEAAAGVLTDHYGNAWAGLSGSAALNFTTSAPAAPAQLLITEVNSNAERGDFFELYNYGTTAIDLTGWKFIDNKADPDHEDAREFAGVTTLAAGARLVVITDETDVASFRAAWGLDAGVPVVAGATEGPGLGKGDAVVVFDADGNVAAALNYGTSALTAADGTVIAPVARTDGNEVVNGHAGVAVGGADPAAEGVSAVWDGLDPANPRYQAAVPGQNGAFAQPGAPENIGSPGKVTSDPIDDGDDEVPPPPPPPPPPPGEPVVVEGSAGDDEIVVPDDQPLTTIITGGGNDVVTGGAGIETVVVPVTLSQVLQLGIERGSDGTLVLNTPTGAVTLQNVERVHLSDGSLFALDVDLPTQDSPGGHTGQVLAVAFAGLGLVLNDATSQRLSAWVRLADELDDFGAFAQAAIDEVAPGVSNQNLVNHLFWLVTGEFANAQRTAFWVAQIGAGQAYETQGDLLAMVASLPQFTEVLVDLIGAPQVQLDAAAFDL